MSAPNLASELATAQAKAQDLHTKLSHAEAALRDALDNEQYGDAEKLKAGVDGLRHEHLIAAAHAQALQAGADALAAVLAQEEQEAAERSRRQQAAELYEQAREREAEALDEQNQLMAEIPAAYEALRRVMAEAIAAADRVTQARQDMHQTGIVAGHIDPNTAAPHRANDAEARITWSPILSQILRTAELYS